MRNAVVCEHGVHPCLCGVPACTGVNVQQKPLPTQVQRLLDSSREAAARRANHARVLQTRADDAHPDVQRAVQQLRRQVETPYSTRAPHHHNHQLASLPPHPPAAAAVAAAAAAVAARPKQWDDVVLVGGGRLQRLPAADQPLGVVHRADARQRWEYEIRLDECGTDLCVSAADLRRATAEDKAAAAAAAAARKREEQQQAGGRSGSMHELPMQLSDWPRPRQHPADSLESLPHDLQLAAADYTLFASRAVGTGAAVHQEVEKLLREQADVEAEVERVEARIEQLRYVTLHPCAAAPCAAASPGAAAHVLGAAGCAAEVASSEPAEVLWRRKDALRARLEELQERMHVFETLVAKMCLTLVSKATAAPAMSQELQHDLMFQEPHAASLLEAA